MWTGICVLGRSARSSHARTVPTVVIAGLLGLAPLAASSAATPNEGAARFDGATTAAMIELAPLAPTAEVTAPAGEPEGAERAAVTPSAPLEAALGRGSASYYAATFHGRRTASGEAFDNRAMTAAHRTLPFGTMVRVTNPRTGASVVVRINDRGPFTKGRLIDVSRAAAEQLGIVRAGHGQVALELLSS